MMFPLNHGVMAAAAGGGGGIVHPDQILTESVSGLWGDPAAEGGVVLSGVDRISQINNLRAVANANDGDPLNQGASVRYPGFDGTWVELGPSRGAAGNNWLISTSNGITVGATVYLRDTEVTAGTANRRLLLVGGNYGFYIDNEAKQIVCNWADDVFQETQVLTTDFNIGAVVNILATGDDTSFSVFVGQTKQISDATPGSSPTVDNTFVSTAEGASSQTLPWSLGRHIIANTKVSDAQALGLMAWLQGENP